MPKPPRRRAVDALVGVLSMNDHDLLIEIRTKIEGLASTVKDNGQKTDTICAKLIAEKADEKDILDWKRDHEERLRRMESQIWRWVGALASIQVGMGIVFWLWK